MERAPLPCDLVELTMPRFGLIALQSDETIEGDLRRLLPSDADFMVSRVPSAPEVTTQSLAAMEGHLASAAGLFPQAAPFDVVAYGCTSGTAQIGADQVTAQVRAGVEARAVTQPLDSLIAACRRLGLTRVALLSPYVPEVSRQLQSVLRQAGIDTPVFGSFEVGTEAQVVRICPSSLQRAALGLMEGADVDGLFLSCTNLRALDVIAPLEAQVGKPVLSSNQVLAWHMTQLAGAEAQCSAPGRLFMR